MPFSLRIESLDNKTCALILNDRFILEASFPLQEEWLLQAIFSALKSAGYEPSAFLTRHPVGVPSRIEELRRRAASKPAPKTSTEVISLKDLDL